MKSNFPQISFDPTRFLEVWNEALREAKRSRTNPVYDGWEGRKAYPVLEKGAFLEMLTFGSSGRWKTLRLFEELSSLVNAYIGAAARLSQRESLRLKRLDPLKLALQHLRSVARRGVYSYRLRRKAERLCEELTTEIERIKSEIENETWYGGLPTLAPEIQASVPAVKRAADLEAWFQVSIAFGLVSHLGSSDEIIAKLGIANISRLVILFYISAGLAESVQDQFSVKRLRILRTGKPLIRQQVEENLHRRNIKRAAIPTPLILKSPAVRPPK